MSSSSRRAPSRVSRSHPNCRSPSQDFLAEAAGEDDLEELDDEDVGEGEVGLEQGRMPSSQASSSGDTRKPPQDRRHPFDDQPKSSSTEEKSASSSTAAATTTGTIAVSKTAAITAHISSAESSAAMVARKRRSSIGHRFSNVLGISKKNTTSSGTGKFKAP